MRAWKTTTWGAVASIAFGFVLFAPEHFEKVPWLVDLAKFLAAAGIFGGLYSASDKGKKADK